MKVDLTPEQIEVIKRALDLNFMSNDLDELKDDPEFYKDYKNCRMLSERILKKLEGKK